MAIILDVIHVWADDPVHCKATLKGEKFKDVKKVEFVFNEKGKEVARAEAKLDPKSGKAAGTWDKAKGPDKPELVRKLHYHVELDGKKLTNLPEEIQVWARELEVVAKTKDDKPYDGALARIHQVSEKNPQEGANVLRKTDKDGKIVWRLAFPGAPKVEWERPYFLLDKKWNKSTGIEWEAKVHKVAPVKLQWPPPGKPHKQWVNFDTDDAKPDLGPTLKVKVVAGKDGPVEKGNKIYLKAEFGKDNSERTPMAGGKKKSEKLELNKEPDALGAAEFDVPVGYAGGDTVTISVGSTDECKDGSVTVETWRRLYYELMAPECMKPRLSENSAKKWDLDKTTAQWAKTRLNAVFVEYELKESHVFEDAKVTKWLHDGAYLGRPAGNYYVLGSPAAYNNDPVPFGAAENRTIFVRCCDVVADANAAADMELEVTKEETPSKGPEIYKVDPGTGNPSVSNVTWEAVIDPAANPAHPGVAAGKAKTGALAVADIELVTKTRFKVKLTGDAAALVGKASKTKCPIKVKWKWQTADPYNGSANGGRQLMNLGRPVRPVACTICHELGHSMGMTVLEKATDATHVAKGQPSVFQRKPPEGLAYPPPVPDGESYDGHDHTGSHCASGLTKAQKSGDHYGGMKGICIMFGEGGDEKNPTRDSFCETCAKYLKARNLSDLKTNWTARGKSSDYEKGG
jgi:hypothetical protein